MIFTSDMKDFVALLEKHDVAYVLIGGFAVNYYGYVRTTQDFDILVMPSKENAQKTMVALKEFGFGKAGISQKILELEGTAIHLGVEPNRIDVLTRIKGVSIATIFSHKKRIKYLGVSMNIIALPDLLRSKMVSKRPKDNADADELKKIALKSEIKNGSKKNKNTKKG
jgi:hypothetical protein